MTFQPGAMVYTQGFGSRPENVEVPHLDVRAPTSADILYPIGKRWINTVLNDEYVLTSFTASAGTTTANWVIMGGSNIDVSTLTGDSGGPVSPTGGNINTIGDGSITIVGSGSTLTTELTGLTNHAVLVGAGTTTITKIPATANTGAVLQNNSGGDPSYSTATYPSTTTINQILYSSAANTVTGLATANNAILNTNGSGVPSLATSPSASGTITAGTGFVATTGNITATTGNFVASAAASGLVLTPTVTSGAASGTVAANGRVVSVTFTGVSIASGATQAFTTSNTSITGSGTVLALTWSGATAGSALSVASIANTAGQSVITMTNGTSVTMVTSVANITFTYLVLN